MSVERVTSKTFTSHVPVLIIGAGACGTIAALAAAEKGIEVLILERDAKPSGSTALSGGFLAFAGTDLQKTAGIDDSNARLADDLRQAGANENDPRLIDVYVANQMATYEWLTSIGVNCITAPFTLPAMPSAFAR